jgi:hypothetical protein
LAVEVALFVAVAVTLLGADFDRATSQEAGLAGPAEASSCPPVPLVIVDEHFGPGAARFAPESRAMRRLRVRFSEAFAKACREGVLRNWSAFASHARRGDRVYLRATKEVMRPWLHLEPLEDTGLGDKDIVLEYRFVSPRGAVRVPRRSGLEEAILCGVDGRYRPTQKMTEDILECLPS